VTAPFGRRLCEVAANRDSGGYRVLSLVDREGPEPQPGQFYMLTAAEGWGARDGRVYLPRAISVAETRADAEGGGIRLDFLLDSVGPGTERLCAAQEGEGVWIVGPLGNSFASPVEVSPAAAGAVLVGGGVGVAPLALLRRHFSERAIPHRVLLGFRDRLHTGGLDLFCGSSGALCPEVRLTTEDGSQGVQGRVTDLLLPILAGDDASSAVVYTCGPPAMLEAVRTLCESHDVPCQIADESPMACGFGACFGCAVPKPDGGYMRLCIDGPVLSAGGTVGGPVAEEALATGGNGGSPAVTGPADQSTPDPVNFCGIELQHPVINASGTYDAIAARTAFGDALLDDFPFAVFVSKTITPEPRAGNAPIRIWETASGMLNSIGLPNKGLDGFLAEDLPRLAELPVPLIVSIMATTREDFARCVERVAARQEVAGIELNVSCPNVHSGLIVGENPSETEALMDALRPLTEKPLIVKLTPNTADPAAVAAGAERGGADAVSLINTLKGTAVDPATGAPALGNGYGGLSGPAVRPVALEQVRSVRARVEMPIVGMGGISSGAEAAEFLALGATVVAVGTESFRDPRAGSRVAAELESTLLSERSTEPALHLD
jgi:dihydroorotate dehydrogenase (NAD+) catalytic subunit